MGFQHARKTFNDLFAGTMNDVNEMLREQWERDNYVPQPEIAKNVNKILDEYEMESVFYSTSWETIEQKARPVIADELVPDDTNKTAWLLAFMLGWNSFGKLLPNRINNTARLIRKEYEKNTKRIYRDVFRATKYQDINAKVFGESLSPPVKKRYSQLFKKDKKRASEYLDEQFGRKAGRVADKRNRRTPNHFANRTTETEALTIRMNLALKSAGESGEIDYITISVKPKACQTCLSFVGQKYPPGQQPHLLAHPNCRCDYIIHYKSGQTLLIPGSGRVDLIT